MKRVVVSAFAPFGAYPVNSSESVAMSLARTGVDGFEISVITFSAIIPAEDRGQALVDRAREIGASGIISLGMASGKRGICVESVARNAIDNATYCPHVPQGTPVDTREEHGARLPIDLRGWSIDAFETSCRAEGILVEHSADAGGFCCNHLAWQTLAAIARQEAPVRYLFLHLPCCPEAVPEHADFVAAGKVSMTTERMHRGIELLLRHAAP